MFSAIAVEAEIVPKGTELVTLSVGNIDENPLAGRLPDAEVVGEDEEVSAPWLEVSDEILLADFERSVVESDSLVSEADSLELTEPGLLADSELREVVRPDGLVIEPVSRLVAEDSKLLSVPCSEEVNCEDGVVSAPASDSAEVLLEAASGGR